MRDARITDVGRIAALLAAPSAQPAAAMSASGTDLLRQLIYLPNAAVLVADARRVIVGAAVLALRPSVAAGGMVGTVDLLVVDPAYEGAGVVDSLLGEALRSARNKGCVAVEAVPPARSSRPTTLVRPRLRRGRSPPQTRPDACGRGARSISRPRSGWRSSGALSAIIPAHRTVARAYRRLA